MIKSRSKKPMSYLGFEDINSRKVKVYDVVKKELIEEFESITKASEFTGVTPQNITSYIKHKHRSYTNKLNKTLAFR